MDTFTFTIALLLMMIAAQYNQTWLMLAIVALMIITTRSLGPTIVLLIAAAFLILGKPLLQNYWPFVLFGLVILAILLGKSKQQQQPEYYDMMGGMGMPGGV